MVVGIHTRGCFNLHCPSPEVKGALLSSDCSVGRPHTQPAPRYSPGTFRLATWGHLCSIQNVLPSPASKGPPVPTCVQLAFSRDAALGPNPRTRLTGVMSDEEVPLLSLLLSHWHFGVNV